MLLNSLGLLEKGRYGNSLPNLRRVDSRTGQFEIPRTEGGNEVSNVTRWRRVSLRKTHRSG